MEGTKLDLTQAGVGVIQQNANQLELVFRSLKWREFWLIYL
jgi:hypothetical protein